MVYSRSGMDSEDRTLGRAIGFGCVVTLLLSAFCTGGTCYYAARDVVVLRPQRVEEIADRILPGARALPGYRGFWASRVTAFECAILADAKNQGNEDRYYGTAFRIFSLKRTEASPRWQKLEPQIRAAPGDWGRQQGSTQVELTVDGRKVGAKQYTTVDGGLGYRIPLLTQERAVMLIVAGPKDGFDEPSFYRFLDGLDLDRRAPPSPFSAVPPWLIGLFAVLGAALLTVGLYIVKEAPACSSPQEDDAYEL